MPCCCSTAPAGTRKAPLNTPKNIATILLPSRAPELNPVENIWHYLRQTWLSNRVFNTRRSSMPPATLGAG
jgi:transposase